MTLQGCQKIVATNKEPICTPIPASTPSKINTPAEHVTMPPAKSVPIGGRRRIVTRSSTAALAK